jgi:hypothetical protein
VRFVSAQLASSPPFPLYGADSPPADVVTPLRRVTLHSHRAKTNSLHPLHLLATLCPVASTLESKPKHWFYTTATSHSPQTAQLTPSTAIKNSSHPWSLSPPLNHVSILHSPYSQSTTSSELQSPPSFPFTSILCSLSRRIMTLIVMN